MSVEIKTLKEFDKMPPVEKFRYLAELNRYLSESDGKVALDGHQELIHLLYVVKYDDDEDRSVRQLADEIYYGCMATRHERS